MEASSLYEKKTFIYDKIQLNKKYHSKIYDLICLHGLNYTKNNNGIFINLNSLDEGIITKLYYLLQDDLQDGLYYDLQDDLPPSLPPSSPPGLPDDLHKYQKEIKSKKKKIIKKNIYMNGFSIYDKEIINDSKKYDL
jgi:hypothetical protein